MKNVPTPVAHGLPFPIVRARQNAPLDIVLTCRELIGIMTHWDSSRTVLCLDPAPCEWCTALQPRRWIGWIACSSQRTGQNGLLQFTPHVGNEFANNQGEHSDLLGMKCRISRQGRRQNSPLAYAYQGWQTEAAEISIAVLVGIVERLFDPLPTNRAA